MNNEVKPGILPGEVLQIGFGALGVHLKPYLESHFDGVSLIESREAFQRNKTLEFSKFKFIFLAVQDKELEALIAELIKNVDKVVHFSGFHYFENSLGIHPVCSFSKQGTYDFKSLSYVVDRELCDSLKRLFPKSSLIKPNLKKDYHSYLSVTANALQLLVNQISGDFEQRLGLDSDLLREIVLQSLEREKAYGEKAFSGPWVRGEKMCQDLHVESMSSRHLKNLNKHFNKSIEKFKKERGVREHS